MGVPFAMPTGIHPRTIARARALRRNMTAGEAMLWSKLREFRTLYGVHVRKQAPIGPYIADFAIHEKGMVIEVDGEHHFTDDGLRRDVTRDMWISEQGYRILHFSTGDIAESLDGCVEKIISELGLMS